jgi:integrase
MPAKVKDNLTLKAVEAAKPGDYVWDAQVRGFGLRVAPGGTKTFIFQFRTRAIDPHTGRLHQGRIKIGQFPSFGVEAAREAAKGLERKVAAQANPSHAQKVARTQVNVKTLADLATLYTDVWAAERGLRPKTIAEAKRLLAPVLASFGALPVTAFTRADIEAIHAQARVRKPPRKPKAAVPPGAATSGKAAEAPRNNAIYQANRLLAVLHKLFSLAKARGWPGVHVNPCQGVEKYKENARKRALSDAEIGRLLAACDASPTKWKGAENVVRLLLFTGARLREVVRAEWVQFDLEAGVWEKPSSHTKTKIVHRVRLEGPVLERLRSMRERDPFGRFLFPGRTSKGETPTGPRADLNKPWQWLVKEAGLTNVRIHDLRRTTSSVMASSGVSAQIIGAVLGHTQASTTARYISIASEPQSAAIRSAGEAMTALAAAAANRRLAVNDA